jgi:hypothetical protein
MSDHNTALTAAAEALREMSGWPLADCRFAAQKMLIAAAARLDFAELANNAVAVLARCNISADIQQLLLKGDSRRSISSGALQQAIKALVPISTQPIA